MEEKDGKVSFTRQSLNLPADANQDYGVSGMYEALDGSFWLNTSFGLARRLRDARLIFYPYQSARSETVVRLTSSMQHEK